MSNNINSERMFGKRADHISSLRTEDVFGTPPEFDMSNTPETPKKKKKSIGFDFEEHMIREIERKKLDEIAQKVQASNKNKNSSFIDIPAAQRPEFQPTALQGKNVSVAELQKGIKDNSKNDSVQKFSFWEEIGNLYFHKFNQNKAILAFGTIAALAFGYSEAKIFFDKHFNPIPATAYNMERTMKAPQYQIDEIKNITPDEMNDILFYMDYRAADTVNQAAEHWHVLNHAVKEGHITKDEALPYLEKTKHIHENFIKEIQEAKDSMTIFYKKSRDPFQEDKIFRVSNPQAETVARVLALGTDGEKNPILKDTANYKTQFEKFQEWYNRKNLSRYYFPNEIVDVKTAIQRKLGHKYYKDSLFYAHMEIAAGVKPQFNSPLFDSFGNVRDVANPIVEIAKTKGLNFTETYKNQMFPELSKKEQIHSSPIVKLDEKPEEILEIKSVKPKIKP